VPKIAHLTSVHPPFDTRIFHKECRALRREGHDVVLIVPHDRDEVVDGVRIRAVPKAVRRSERMAKIERMTRTVWAIYRAALKEEADVYHLHDVELVPLGMLLRLRGRAVIYDIHEDYPRDMVSKYYLPVWLRPPLGKTVEMLENFAARHFSALIIATPHIYRRYQHVNARTAVVQNFPLLDELASDVSTVPWAQRKAAVAYIGNITTVRCIREMISAVALLPEDPAAELHLAGAYSPENLRDQVAKLPGWKRVRELGYLDRRGVKQSLGRVQAGLVLFYPEPNYVNAYSNKMFEYMAAGIPVIASNFPLWREIVHKSACGILVDPLDPRAIAGAIEYVLNNPKEAEAMGRRGRLAVQVRYNWENEERKLLALYEEVLKNSSQARLF
jgi:glycosyltransferase involved in cell wall biosynthesis